MTNKTKKVNADGECELYAARFRRDFNSLSKSLNSPRSVLTRVIVKSRNTEQPVIVAVSAKSYTAYVNDLARTKK